MADDADDEGATLQSVSFVRVSLLLAVAMLLAGAGLQPASKPPICCAGFHPPARSPVRS